ncbi:MAG: hypothetical protein KC414_10900 [Romboutsia sp.]|nr:hypothetical protein [Romboutsia sp.]
MLTDIEVAKKLLKIHQSAQARNLDFDLSFSEVKRLLSVKKCFYSGEELESDEKSENQRTFDRVDNTKGYVNGNVVACTKKINHLKNNLTIEEIKIIVKGLKKKKLW